MKYLIKKVYLISFFIIILLFSNTTFAMDKNIKYSRNSISNYFSGIISARQYYTNTAFEHLNKVQSLKNTHRNYNVHFLRTLILLEKFDKAFSFSKSIWRKDQFFFEVDFLLGLHSFINEEYKEAEKYFLRLNKINSQGIISENFLGNILLSWTKAAQNDERASFDILDKISDRYINLKRIQNIFLQCHFDTSETEAEFKKLVNDEGYIFSRYNFFLANYLLHKNKKNKAKKIIFLSSDKNQSNLLLKQSKNFFLTNKDKKIKKFFNCENRRDNIAEIMYVLANLYASEKNYELSNFYLNISIFLNKKFISNKALAAENFYYQKKYEFSKNTYKSIKSIGPVYSWYASKNIATILLKTENKENSITTLVKDFKLLKNPDVLQYYEMANFYKDNAYYEESVKYYSLVLKKINEDHRLFAKSLDRRGTSYERMGDWEKAERDLEESLRILPDQPYVLNYLAYLWIEKGINLDKALDMLKQATSLREDDGYIIDSLGWGYFAKKDYVKAKEFLQRAVELMPLDPIINDHYGDALWMLNKDIQARYVWNFVLNLEDAEEELKEDINKKLIFGIKKKL